MTRSQNDPLSDADTPLTTDERDELPVDESRLVLREEGVTTVIYGDAETVEQRLDTLLESHGIDGTEFDIDQYPMPDPLNDERVDLSE